jgi:hypothetical protein
MSKKSKQDNLNAVILSGFMDQVQNLIERRSDWQSNEYKTANDKLYDMLADIYELYLKAKGNLSVDAEKRDWLIEQCQSKGIKMTKKPTLLQLVTKLVFFDSLTDSRRVSSYARVLNAAAQLDIKLSSEIPAFIRKHGGVEEIRASLAPNTMKLSDRAQHGRTILGKQKRIATVLVEKVANNVTLAKGQVVLLAGIVTPQGDVDVRSVCFEDLGKENVIQSRTAVNAVLSGIYSYTNRNLKASSKTIAAEKEAAEKESLFAADPSDVAEEVKLAA